jgi:tetratricopeptide (TPR) repeat protein
MVDSIRPARRFLASTVVVVALVAVAAFGLRIWLAPRSSVATLLRQAASAMTARDDRHAAEILEQVLQRDPRNTTALLYRGQVARNLGDQRAAERYWRRIPDDQPRDAAAARLLEGMQTFAAYRARDAERLFRRSLELFPESLEPRQRLVYLYRLQLRDADLRGEMRAIRSQRPWTVGELLFSTGFMGRVIPSPSQMAELEKFVAADSRDVASLLALAECQLADDRADEAIALLTQSLAALPAEQALRGRLVEDLLRQGKIDRARDVLGNDRSTVMSVELARAYGAYYAATNDWQQAVVWLERSAEFDAFHFPTVFSLGLALERAGRHDEAAQTLHRARLMEQVTNEKARLVEQIGPQVWRDNGSELKVSQFTQRIFIEIGRLLIELEQPYEASAWLEQALAWNPADRRARSLHARASDRARVNTAVASVEFAPNRPGALPVQASTTRLAPVPPSSAPRFVDRHEAAGLNFQYRNGAGGSKYILETLGGGVAAFDFDADGWPDLYFCQGCPLPVGDAPPKAAPWRDRLFHNLGGSSRDVTDAAGLGDAQYSQGCTAADFNNDGFTDLAVANFGTNVLYRNNGDGTFADVTNAAGIAGGHWSSSLAFADFDRDGNLDLYAVTYVLDPYLTCQEGGRPRTCNPQNFAAEPDLLFRSNGDGTFEDMTVAAGVNADDGKGLGIVVADFDDDGWPDIYVANDTTPNFLFQNQSAQAGGRLRFEERGLVSGAGVSGLGASQAGMGIACGDFDGDGLLDLVVTNFYLQSATFYRNQGNLLFVDDTRTARLEAPTRMFLGFGTQAIDVDLDGWLDLFIANGHVDDYRDKGQPWKMLPQLFLNTGEGVFADASRGAGPYFQDEYLGRAAARLDWNRDGRPDLVVVHLDRPVALLQNETEPAGARLVLDLHGVQSNRDAIGARIMVHSGGRTLVHEICGGDGFQATNERRMIFGLGSSGLVERLEVRWPDGRQDSWSDIPADSLVVLIEGKGPQLRKLERTDWAE